MKPYYLAISCALTLGGCANPSPSFDLRDLSSHYKTTGDTHDCIESASVNMARLVRSHSLLIHNESGELMLNQLSGDCQHFDAASLLARSERLCAGDTLGDQEVTPCTLGKFDLLEASGK